MEHSFSRRNHLKTIAITIIGMLITVILHELWKDPFQDVTKFPPSKIRLLVGSMKPLLGTSLFLLFLVIAYTYNKIQHSIPAANKFKPWYYGITAGGLWIMAMVEGTPWLSLSFSDLFLSGLADLIPIVIMSVLLQHFLFRKQNENIIKEQKIFPSIIVIPLFYAATRYFSYYILEISSGIHTNPAGSFIWTWSMGVWIWIMYHFMGVDNWNKSAGYKVWVFGGQIFGLIWISINGIGALISSDFSLTTVLLRTIPDTISILISVYVLAYLKKPEKSINLNLKS